MEKWSLSAEMIAIIMVLMMLLFSHNKERIKTVRRTIFNVGLLLTLLSSTLNILCINSISNYWSLPRSFNILLNSMYFLVSVGMSTMMAVYFFDLFLEHVYDEKCTVRATIGTTICIGVYLIIFLANFRTGCLFYFDRQGNYHRGPLNKSGYFVMLAELTLVVICYFHNRASIEKKVINVVRAMPPIAILLWVFQFIYPEVLLNGFMGAVVYLIIFVNFQNINVERDGLTGLRNRKCFYNELMLRRKGKQEFQVILVSLQNFAMVNEHLGYRQGDEVLYCIAQWLDNCVKNGQAYRFGNVTFALLCPYNNEQKAQNLLDTIEERFKSPWEIGDLKCSVSACFGSMCCKKDEWDTTQTIEILTFMMERAKKKGKVEFNAEIEHMFQQKKNLQLLLKNSIETKRFEVWYQPIYDCRNERFISAEALVRLKDYQGNWVSPAEFIPVAEENGMIEEIGWIVWEEVCAFLGKHPELPLVSVSVNMSVQQLVNPELITRLEESLKRNQVPIEKIGMEITERVVLSDESRMKHLMDEYAKKGVKFYMDDFGTGYSNFSSVMHLPFEVIKLDRSLINEVEHNKKDALVVQSMINLFHSMGFTVTSEGIESEAQRKLLCDMGVDYIQGFYYSKPMPAEQLTRFLKED